MPARSVSIAALSPKPLIITLAPSLASARAMASPIPEVEPVTTADFPLSMLDSWTMVFADELAAMDFEDQCKQLAGALAAAQQCISGPASHFCAHAGGSTTSIMPPPPG